MLYDDEYHAGDPEILPLHTGVEWPIEDEAEKILAEDRREQRSASLPPPDDYQILTRDQELLRRSREVLGPYGAPDRAVATGMYRRAYNPLAGQRPVKLRQGDE